MKKTLLIIISLIIFLLSALLHKNHTFTIAQKPKKLTIVCTTSIITDTVQRITGNTVNVVGLMGPGIDPHIYRAREGDVVRLATADIIFYNGLNLEGKMAHILPTMNAYTKSFAVSNAISPSLLRSPAEFEQSYDPHIWLDVVLWTLVVDYIAKILITHDPANKALYQKNITLYKQELAELHKYVARKAEELPSDKRILITAHDAFGYFGARYGFTVVGLQGISTESHAGMKDIHALATYIVQNKVRSIFVESSISERSLRAVQEAVHAQNWQVNLGHNLYSDALGHRGSGADTYTTMIRHNIDTMVEALRIP